MNRHVAAPTTRNPIAQSTTRYRAPGLHVATLAVLVALAGCAGAPVVQEDDGFGALVAPPPVGANGSIYQAATSLALFEDLKARRVGDILTIRLEERTSATKNSSTSTSKSTDAATANANVFGYDVTRDGVPIFSGSLDSDQSFSGEGGSSQSNRLSGSITVTVVGRQPNGNLLVQGEKRMTLNQGEEYIRISGIVRPLDIEPDNSVPSEKIGNARITYSGRGALADANRMNWLARFFNSPWLPL